MSLNNHPNLLPEDNFLAEAEQRQTEHDSLSEVWKQIDQENNFGHVKFEVALA